MLHEAAAARCEVVVSGGHGAVRDVRGRAGPDDEHDDDGQCEGEQHGAGGERGGDRGLPNRRVNRGVATATAKFATVIGRKAPPASSGL